MARSTADRAVPMTGIAMRRRRAKATRVTIVATATPVHTDRSRVSSVPMKQSTATKPAATLARPRQSAAADARRQRTDVQPEPVGDGVGERTTAASEVDAVVGIEDVLWPHERVRTGHLEQDGQPEVGAQDDERRQQHLSLAPGRVDHRREVEDQEREQRRTPRRSSAATRAGTRCATPARSRRPRAPRARARSGPVAAAAAARRVP